MANDEEYRKAANAVQNGTADRHQKELNDRMAKNMGSLGSDARAAAKGEKKW